MTDPMTPRALPEEAVEALTRAVMDRFGGPEDGYVTDGLRGMAAAEADACVLVKALQAAGWHLSRHDPHGARWPTPDELAERFHAHYELLAPTYGYETRRESAVPWSEVPEANRALMTAVCARILDGLMGLPTGEGDDSSREGEA